MIHQRNIPGEGLPLLDCVAIAAWQRIAAGYFASDSAAQLAAMALSGLWPKVGRALRCRSDPARFIAEEKSLPVVPWISWRDDLVPDALMEMGLASAYSRRNRIVLGRINDFRASNSRPLTFAPIHSDRLNAALHRLNTSTTCAVWVGGSGEPVQAALLQPTRISDKRLQRAAQEFIENQLAVAGIVLLPRDQRLLKVELAALVRGLARARQQLEAVRPELLLVHADNHPPHQLYVCAAKQLGIRSLMVQHGLDCEIAALDEAYADVIATWGPQRVERYQSFSQNKNSHFVVTGNPEFDRRPLARRIDPTGDYWLWVTRPHGSDKCYLPSRWTDEGLQILRALLESLAEFPQARLVIKPHPYDTIDLYRKELSAMANAAVASRVSISRAGLGELFERSALVIGEDSTAGLEAMLAGKPLIHAHFALSPPAMPFADNGGAISAHQPHLLCASIRHALRTGSEELQLMLAGQQKTMLRLAGPCDGNAGARVAGLVESILSGH